MTDAQSISIHALLAESDTIHPRLCNAKPNFYPRSPCGERLNDAINGCNPDFISIHALLAESDTVMNNIVLMPGEFLSTLSLRRATSFTRPLRATENYFYPRSPCGERRYWPCVFVVGRAFLSTLSLRRATLDRWLAGLKGTLFLSTLSLRRATRGQHPSWGECLFLSTLSLRRATAAGRFRYLDNIISIHALLAESDIRNSPALLGNSQFLSTLSLRRATVNFHTKARESQNFYPRSPCGERRLAHRENPLSRVFLSTLSLRRATRSGAGCLICLLYFYPRSPCGERQIVSNTLLAIHTNFYPRSPCGERHDATLHCLRVMRISIHALLAESDQVKQTCRAKISISIHALLAESDPQ